jgi:hypothetical protein
MFGDLESRLGHIEHLPLLNPRDHRCRQPDEAMATGLRFVPLDDVGLCDLLQRVASMSRLPAARLVRLAAQAAGNARRLLQAVARRRLAAVRAVLVQLTPEIRDAWRNAAFLSPQNLNLAPQRVDQVANLGSENHSYLDSCFPTPRLQKSHARRHFPPNCCSEDSPQLGSYR